MILMSERKNKRMSEVGVVEADSEEVTFIVEPASLEVGCGYTVAVSHDDCEREVIDVKTYGQVDIAQLRREIQSVFPDAEIRRINQSDSVTILKAMAKKNRRKKK